MLVMFDAHNRIHLEVSEALSMINNLGSFRNHNLVLDDSPTLSHSASFFEPPAFVPKVLIEVSSVPFVPPNPLIQSLMGDHLYAFAPAIAHYLIRAIILLQQLSRKLFLLLFESTGKLPIPPSELGSLLCNGWFIIAIPGVAIAINFPCDR
jgi:hypothetical protein